MKDGANRTKRGRNLREAAAGDAEATGGEPAASRFRPPSRRTFVAMLGAAATAVVLRDRLTGRDVIRNPATGKPIWIGHV
jgi:hypothetical protein